MKSVAASRIASSIVPSLTLFHFQQPEVVTRPLSWTGLTRHIYLVQRRDRDLSLAAQSLHDWMLQRRPEVEATAGRVEHAPPGHLPVGARAEKPAS